MRVLVVEDEQETAQPLIQGLERHGHDTIAAATGAQALDAYPHAELVLLDIGLPDMDGLEVCRRMRSADDTPIIAFTDTGAEVDKILGLQAGSDDCLSKPYVFRELMARVEAVMRRVRPQVICKPEEPKSAILSGPLLIDAATRQVWLARQQVEMTRKEFDLLHYLASRPGEVLPRHRLMVDVWDYPADRKIGLQSSRTIDTHVSALRRKLGSCWICTIRGIGFSFRQQQ
ncbi:hypothetical protein A6A06_36005 [Streptomyces sp. CB02923]|uniref:response regulator transcription factor n=1 Tax=Streptomyces sp. CB02923 TaxID=1718985 RepID=UPI00093D2055|nr:response regulator transcription factor [Streptomyces sp. CB02923]OKI07320.1 hypothetical protein A6A06_36005 [Streptomyces sp. CB02923]